MSNQIIEKLLKGFYPTKKPILTKAIRIEKTLRDKETSLISQLNFGKSLAVVCDPDTHRVLGNRIISKLSKEYNINSILLNQSPTPDIDTVEYIISKTATDDALIAVGSGTINDLCKYTAYKTNKPYAVFGTAPSMNGYSSANAAITVHGHKKSLEAQVPAGIFLDLEVLSNAPKRMIQSGFGDSCARSTAQADWMLANFLFDIPYNQDPFDILVDVEKQLFTNPARLMNGDIESMRTLADTLILSGFGMTICGGSMPASQSEHLISHYIEMLEPEGTPQSFHGEHIAVTTLTIAKIQESVLREKAPKVKCCSLTENDFIKHYGEQLGKSCWAEFDKKRISSKNVNEINKKLESNWKECQDKIQRIILPSSTIEKSLKEVGAPTHYSQLGITRDFYKEAVLHCREVRDRYTFLDFALDCNLYNEKVIL